ncbi:MAG: hypothetical protein ACLU38_12900 [Dysosmobacter sp.]
MSNIKLTRPEKEKRRRVFRAKIVISLLLPCVGAGLLAIAYCGRLPLGTLATLFLSGVLIVSGLLISLTLFRCPYCGKRINIRGLLYKYFYACPYCDFGPMAKFV